MSLFIQSTANDAINNAVQDDFCDISCHPRKNQSQEKQRQDVPIFLIGMRACGKTTLGQALAQRMNRPFVDTDQVICDLAMSQGLGTDVASIVEREGWEGFRAREARALRDIVKIAHMGQNGMVIATGGGMVIRPDNREYMRQSGLCVYLEASADELWRRLKKNPKNRQRPSLKTMSSAEKPKSPPTPQHVSREEIRALLAEREIFYRQTAHHVLSVHGQLDEKLAELVALCACGYHIEDSHE